MREVNIYINTDLWCGYDLQKEAIRDDFFFEAGFMPSSEPKADLELMALRSGLDLRLRVRCLPY